MSPTDRVAASLVRALGALPPKAKRALAGKPVVRDGQQLALDAQLVLRANGLNPRPPVEERTPQQARADIRRSTSLIAGRPIPLDRVDDTTVAGAEGRLPARLYVPHDAAPGALILFFHGGGWVVGDLDTHDAPCRHLARASGTKVLSVAYRCAPEHPYPAPVEDALAAFRDVAQGGHTKVVVAGDSAGGHLAAMVALHTAKSDGPEPEPTPAMQVLIYPATDFVGDHASTALFADGFLLTKRNMDWYEAQFVPRAEDKAPASPLRQDIPERTAPAFVLTAGFDPLRDEGEAYARKLRQAGVPATIRRHPGQIHGFLNMTAVGTPAREAIAEIAGAIRTTLATTPS
ncbi:MAG TPA: alpha/beta hydrolase [Solirubrobacteraceae bacterium]|nr:alpha/beta hydrolase [Solirubrobacteraceae bacterium]